MMAAVCHRRGSWLAARRGARPPPTSRGWPARTPGRTRLPRLLGARVAAAAIAAALLAGCELTEVTLAESEDVVVAETRLVLNLDGENGAATATAYAYLHRTLSAARANEVEGATVRLSSASRAAVRLEPRADGGACLAVSHGADDPNEDVGSCYRAAVSPSPFAPGEIVELEIVLANGGVLTGSSRIPGAFDFVGLAHDDGHCRLEPGTNYRFTWTEAAGTWSYLSDSWIMGLPEALAGRDVEAPDSLYLTGFGIGEEDTDVLFPGEYGLFDLADDVETDLLRVLDDGLPGGAWAEIAFAATDRNWVNWIRGGNFNPSGIIRIPSVFGDGTGSFGTATHRALSVISAPDGDGVPPLCGPAER